VDIDIKNEWKNRKNPRYLFQDPNEPDYLYWIGRLQGKGAIIKFGKA